MSKKIKSAKRQRAIALLAMGYNSNDVANHLKIRAETLSRWKKQPNFESELEKECRHVTCHLKQRLVALVDNAIHTIDAQLDNTDDNLFERSELGLAILKQFGIHQHFPHDVLLPPAPPKPYTE